MEKNLIGRNIRVLLVEGDRNTVKEIYSCLEPLGYGLDLAENGLSGWTRACSNSYDVLVLDTVLSGMDGLELCRRLRDEEGNETPILMLTDGVTTESRVLCLNRGADDFVSRPVDMVELEARIRSLVRRARAMRESRILRWEGMLLNLRTHEAFVDGSPMRLRPIGFRILTRLMRNAPDMVSRQDLEHDVYGDSPPDSDCLRTHIHLLRQELKKRGKPLLITLPHIGFRLVRAEEEDGKTS